MDVKRVLLVLVALVIVLSGVAMVSAYEAHVINVTAKVENAMSVPSKVEFGTVFPQEWWLKEFSIGSSGSFCAENQTRVSKIDYSIWAEWKPDGLGGWYPWLGDALYIGIDVANKYPQAAGGDLVPIGDPPATQPGAKWVMDAPIPIHKYSPYNLNDTIILGLDVPVFEDYYSELTDVLVKPSGLDGPTLEILKTDTDRYFPDGVTLGMDLKIQVTGIGN